MGPEPIDPAGALARVGSDDDGAVVLFVGIVRNHAEGRSVSGMTYEAYTSMAASELAALASEAAERWQTDRIAVVHRTGALTLGEPSVAIALSTPHRAEGYEASRWIIEAIKERLPIWKHEHFVDGESRWVPGRTPPTPAAS
ncbi:MAG: molybdenum cofactor biosynthesis protein MoaE [Gemmatimonadetes bacterium]|nr:molybdenum cofactor biosynthesis protein MoaE [Gemmatimonadota bacterium]